jgi:hypothetical protein
VAQNLWLRLQNFFGGRTLKTYHIAFCVLVLVWSCLHSLALGKDMNWDLRNYHFYNPAALLTGRLGFDIFPAQMPNWINPLMDIPTYLMIMNFKPWLVGVVMGVWHGLNLILAYLIAQSIFYFLIPKTRTLLATITIILATTGSIVRGLWGTFTGDLTISIFALAALALFLSALTEESDKMRVPKYVASGLILGLGTGLKMTLAFHTIPLLLLTVFLEHTKMARLRAFIVYATACFIGFTITAAWWAVFLQNEYSSPFFPFYNAILHSPFIAYKNIPEYHWVPATFLDHLKMPFIFFTGSGKSDVDFKDWRPGIAYAALIILAMNFLWRLVTHHFSGLLSWKKIRPMVVLVLFTIMSWTIWQIQFSYYRYIAVFEILFPVLIFTITYLLIQKPQAPILVSVVLLIVLLRKTDPLSYERKSWSEEYFAVKIPAELHLENTQVLIADADRPLAYFVPFFPTSTRVIRLTSNMESVLQDPIYSGLNNQRSQAIQNQVRKYVMYDERVNPTEQVEIDRVLESYLLKRDESSCMRITSDFATVFLCPLNALSH